MGTETAKNLKEFLKKVKQQEEVKGINSLLEPLEAEILPQKKVFIQEIAGRDSIASLSQFLRTNKSFEHAVLSVAFAPTEYGNLDYLVKAILNAKSILDMHGISSSVAASISFRLWKELVAVDLLKHSTTYGFYAPCIGCHLYLHILRGILAKSINAKVVVSGERAFHKGLIKLNQSKPSLRVYREVLQSVGVELVYPIEQVDNEQLIKELAGRDWEEGEEQLKCFFTGTSKLDRITYSQIEKNLQKYLIDHLLSKGREVILREISEIHS